MHPLFMPKIEVNYAPESIMAILSGTPICELSEMQKTHIQDTFVKSQCNRICFNSPLK